MARQKKDTYATEADLSWFDLANYAALPGKRAADFDTPESSATLFATWAHIIRDRVELLRFLEAGQTAYVAGQFEKIKAAPLAPLGFGQHYSGGTHQANTATVKALTANRVHWLNEAMERTKAGERDIVDVQLQADAENTFGDYAHVMVNVHATDAQLTADFKKWLTGWRQSTGRVTQGNYVTKISGWIAANAVPCMDLELFSRLVGKPLESRPKLAKLFPTHTESEREAHRRNLVDIVELVFTDQMAKIIAHLAES